jgi:cyanophycinase
VTTHVGPLALVGGDEWHDGCTFDAELLAASGQKSVVVLPTAAAYEQPAKTVEQATRWFDALGGVVEGLMVVARPDASDERFVEGVRGAKFVYLAGGSPLHLRSVLKESPLWSALLEAWRGGAVIAGSAAGAMVLGDPMVDPRGGAFTLGLGLIEEVAVLPEAGRWSHDRLHRTIRLASPDVALLAIDEQTAVIRSADGTWRVTGAGAATVWRNGVEVGLDGLPG